jgi:hypothetical protein
MPDQPTRRHNTFGLGMMTGGGFGLVLGYLASLIVPAIQAIRDPQPAGAVSAPRMVTGTPPGPGPPIAVWVDAECPEPLEVSVAAEYGMELAKRFGCGVKLRYKGHEMLCAPWREMKNVVNEYTLQVEADAHEKGQ